MKKYYYCSVLPKGMKNTYYYIADEEVKVNAFVEFPFGYNNTLVIGTVMEAGYFDEDNVTRAATNPIPAVRPSPAVRHTTIKASRTHLLFSLQQRNPHTNPIPQNQSLVSQRMNTVPKTMLMLMISITTITMISTIMRTRRIIITSMRNNIFRLAIYPHQSYNKGIRIPGG